MSSIIGLAMRTAAVRALRGATSVADQRILDSSMLPIDQMTAQEPTPFIVISTEEENGAPDGRDINNGSRTLELVIEIALAQAISITLPEEEGGGEELIVSVPNTDAGLEMSLALIGRQVFACLFGRGGGAWGGAFRQLCTTIQRMQSRRGLPTKDGQRFAARQWVLTVQPIAEPAFAEVEDETPLAAFFAAMAADDTFPDDVAEALRNAIEGKPADWPAVYNAAALLGGYTDAEGDQIGIGLLEPEADPPTVQGATNSETGLVADADTMAEQLPEGAPDP